MLKKLISFSFLATLVAVPLSAGNSDPILRKGMFPAYPAIAIEKRIQGRVRIKAALNSTGRVIQAIPIGNKDEAITFPEAKNDAHFGYESLCQAAQKAALFWEFESKTNLKEIILTFYFELVEAVPVGEDLYPVYIAPFEIRVRGLSPPVSAISN